MNFLLHRHYASTETGDVAVGFGAMLPDLVRLVDRRLRPPARPAADASTVDRALCAGIDHHLDADRWFHGTQTFREGETRTARALRELAGDLPRIGLFAHVTWELCLDGAWLRSGVGPEARLATLRDDVARFAEDAHVTLQRGTTPRAGAEDALANGLRVLWARMPDLAAGYALGHGVARRLDGMRRGLGLARATDAGLERLARVLDDRLDDAGRCLAELDAERQAALASTA